MARALLHLVLLLAPGFQSPFSRAEAEPFLCEEGTIVCHRDCCQRNVQYCNEPQTRCTNCKDRESLCGTNDEPVGCALHCYLLRTTTTPSISTVAGPTASTDSSMDGALIVRLSKPGFIVTNTFLAVLAVVCAALVAWVIILLKRTTKDRRKDDLERGGNVGQNQRGLEDPGDMPVHGSRTDGERSPLLFQDVPSFGDPSTSILTNEVSTGGHVTTEEDPAKEPAKDGGAPTHGLQQPVGSTDTRSGQANMGSAGGDGPRRSSGSDESSARQDGTSMQRQSGQASYVNNTASTVQPENEGESTFTYNNHSMGFDVSSGGYGSASSSTNNSPRSSSTPTDGLATSLKVREDENGSITLPFNNIITTSEGNNQPVTLATGTHNPAAAYAHNASPYPAKA